jgi:hypothetical protein
LQTLQSKNYEVFFAEANKIPNILHEIGRCVKLHLEVGEERMSPLIWTNLTNTTTIFFLWDEECKKLLEPRMGLGSEIFKSMESKVSISMSFSF